MTKDKSRKSDVDSLPDDLLQDSEFKASSVRDVELMRLRDQLNDLKERHADAVARIEQQRRELATFQTLQDDPLKPAKTKAPPKTKGNAAAGVILCDWHAAEFIPEGLLEYPNHHDLEVFRERRERMCQKAQLLFEMCRGFADVHEFHVLVLGDLMNNYLHEDDVETNTLGPTEEMLEVRRHLAGTIDFLFEMASPELMTVTTCHGNHARLPVLGSRRKKHKAQHKTNLEWQICQDLAGQYAESNKPIEWNVSRSGYNRANIKGWDVRIAHGDDVRYEGGIGGLSIPLIKRVKAWNENRRADWTFVAHWHQFLRLNAYRIVTANAMVGYSEFAEAKALPGSPPSQTFVLFDEDKGLIICEELLV